MDHPPETIDTRLANPSRVISLAVIVALAASLSTLASAGGMNLSWDDCGLAGTYNKSFACNTNSGSQTLIVSYEPDAPMSDMVGNDVAIDLIAGYTAMPDWWKMYTGNCRPTAISVSADFTSGPFTCADVWQNHQLGGIGSLTYYSGTVKLARLLVFWGVPSQYATAVTPGTEYYSMKITITNDQTIGSGSCMGCSDPMCVVVDIVQLDGNAGGFQKIQVPRDRNYAYWQGGSSCSTPTRSRTWGQIKSLYR